MKNQTVFDKIPENVYAQVYDSYAEPGYDEPESGIITGDWNNASRELVEELEELGFDLAWLDEWVCCDGCYKLFRTSPNSYGWLMYGAIFDGFALCGDCILEDPSEYIESRMNKTRTAVMPFVDLESLGWERHNGQYEYGLHPGQNDEPGRIAATLPSDVDFVFQIDMTGQFDTAFSLWTRPKE